MKRLWLFFIIICLTGCGTPEVMPSASDYLQEEDNQTHHYHFVHKDHPNWSFAELGSTLTLKTGAQSIKLSVRRHPERIIIRQSHQVVGYVEKTSTGAQLSHVSGEKVLELRCLTPQMFEIIRDGQKVSLEKKDLEVVASNGLVVRKLVQRHRYSISEVQPKNASEVCNGSAVESPFNDVGTLLFHDESIPIMERAGIAWFVTKIPVC